MPAPRPSPHRPFPSSSEPDNKGCSLRLRASLESANRLSQFIFFFILRRFGLSYDDYHRFDRFVRRMRHARRFLPTARPIFLAMSCLPPSLSTIEASRRNNLRLCDKSPQRTLLRSLHLISTYARCAIKHPLHRRFNLLGAIR